jgi:hypothetical protein
MNGYSQKGILHNGAFLLACLAGLVVTDGKNVKILKYRNETKILHGLADLLDENRNTPCGKIGQFGFSRGEVQE